MSGEERRPEAPQGPPWSLDLLSDLHAGALDEETAEALRVQVRDDPEAHEILAALDATSTDLSELPELAMPDDVSARLEAALADEVRAWTEASSTNSAAANGNPSASDHRAPADGGTPAGEAEVVDLAAARQRSRRRRRFGLGAGLLAAAAAVTGVVVISAMPDGSGVQAGAPPAPPVSVPAPLALQGDQLATDQFQEVLKSDQLGALSDPQRLIGCLRANGIASGNPIGSRSVTLNGRPGQMLVLSSGKIGQFRLLTVGTDCGPGNPATISDSTFGG